ncbi:MAG: hypothetical protein EOP53_00335 [Sphingobacteriales bacterium]|nr:MAG: hypothetical protein EOP53_00335 [Sphingobacteriales bacterium]
MKRILFSFLTILAIIIFTVSSCKKDPVVADDNDTDIEAAEDNSYAESVFTDVFNMTDEAAREHAGFYKNGLDEKGILADCAIITADTTVSLRKITIDFGTGCVGKDGRTRTGKIIITFTGRYRSKGTVIKHTFDNYTVNGNKVEGEKTVTNMGKNANGNLVYKIEVKNAKITTSNGIISWESTREREWISGQNTAITSDDEYAVSGAASGTNRRGKTYEATITEPLHVKAGCKWITKGKLEVKPQGKLKRTVDYGNGDCDNVATATIGSKTFTYQMK